MPSMGVARSALWAPFQCWSAAQPFFVSSRNAPSRRTALKKTRSLLCWIELKTFNSSLRLRRNNSLVKPVCETAPNFVLWAPSCVPGFEYTQRLL